MYQLGTSPIDAASYTVDAAGNRTAKTDQATAVTSNYTYDAIYQLLQATQGGNTTESYTYDPVGNRLSSLGVSPYAYNSSNELTSTPNTTYTYDYNGNTVSKTDSTGTTQYAWDYENRLTSVTLPGSAGTVTFKYDPFGRRIEKVTPSGTSIFAYDGDNLIEEADASGVVVARYTDGQSIDEPLAMLRAGATSFYEQDGLGSVTSLTNAAGAVAQTYTYDSFGKLTGPSGAITNPFQYTGRESDSTTGLYYYRARYYDPTTGRFLSEDPLLLTLTSTFNGYEYSLNSPLNYLDPWGLCPWQLRTRPLRGVPLWLQNLPLDLGADTPVRHMYYYNTKTGQSVGFGPVAPSLWIPVPGGWENHENPSSDPQDHLFKPIPDSMCKCVDKALKHPGKPPQNYCTLGRPYFSQKPCTNCWTWALSVLKKCESDQNGPQ